MSFAIFAMPSSSILLLFSIVLGGSEARPWTEAQQTHVYEADAWSPRPTGVLRGAENVLRLFGRDSVDVAICGWIDGKSVSSATCSAGSSCVHDTVHGVVGCCPDTGPCTAGVYTGCVDMNSNGWTPNSGIQTNGVFTCSGTDLCYKNIFPGGYSQYGCGQTNMATSVETTYSGQPSDVRLQQVFTGVEFTAASSSASSSSSITTTSSSSSSSTSSTSSSSSSSTTSSSSTLSTVSTAPKQSGTSNTTPSAVASPSKKSHIVIIVGSVLGGLAGLAIIGALIFFCLAHRTKKRAGPFQSAHTNNPPPTSGPSQRLIPYQPYGPTDFDPRTGEITTAASVGAAGREHPTSYTYAEDCTPPDSHHQFYSSHPAQNQDELPLVQGSEIDDFSESYHRAIGASVPREDGHTLIGSEGEGTGLGLGLGGGGGGGGGGLSRSLTGRSGGGGYGSGRTQDRDVGEEPLRSPVGATVPGFVSEESWEASQRVEPRSPLREGVGAMGSSLSRGLSAAVGRDNAPRYQLVDEIGDDVPVLGSPDRMLRGKKSVKWEEEEQ